MGAKGCSESDQLLATKVALETVHLGLEWADTTIKGKCDAGNWTVKDCNQWNAQKPLIKEVLDKSIPWVIEKLAKTTTPEEREEITRKIKRRIALGY